MPTAYFYLCLMAPLLNCCSVQACGDQTVRCCCCSTANASWIFLHWHNGKMEKSLFHVCDRSFYRCRHSKVCRCWYDYHRWLPPVFAESCMSKWKAGDALNLSMRRRCMPAVWLLYPVNVAQEVLLRTRSARAGVSLQITSYGSQTKAQYRQLSYQRWMMYWQLKLSDHLNNSNKMVAVKRWTKSSAKV